MGDVKLISTLNTPHIVETEKKNQEDETMKKPIKIQGQTKFMCGMDKQTITHTAEKLKWTTKFVFTLLYTDALNTFILFNNHTQTKIIKIKATLLRTSYLTVFRK
jgi:hypothetical protein